MPRKDRKQLYIYLKFKASAFQVQENAYKQYLKSRPLANSTSVKAAKNIRILHPVLPIHPLLSKFSKKNPHEILKSDKF